VEELGFRGCECKPSSHEFGVNWDGRVGRIP
jgi:hypothetical protein